MDPYKFNAAEIYDVAYEDVTKEQRQIGKVAELSLGYQGWVQAFHSMAANYGVKVEDEKAKDIILKWRESRPNTVAFWSGIMEAALKTVKTKQAYAFGKIKFGIRGRFLHCRLPSGRLLSYCDPVVKTMIDKFDREREVITFWGVASDKDKVLSGTAQWGELATYGGKLTENVVQAIARDLLTDAMLRLDEAGYPIVLHVHDEIIADVSAGTDIDKELETFETIMSIIPSWAVGCPISAEGWHGYRYRK
jgi:DNA polymerase